MYCAGVCLAEVQKTTKKFRRAGEGDIRNGHIPNFPPVTQQPLVGQGLLIIEASRSHSDTPHSVGLLWTNDSIVVIITDFKCQKCGP
jgi:hypothetical protein